MQPLSGKRAWIINLNLSILLKYLYNIIIMRNVVRADRMESFKMQIFNVKCGWQQQQFFRRQTAVENGRDKSIPRNTFRLFFFIFFYSSPQSNVHVYLLGAATTSCQDESVNGFILSASQRLTDSDNILLLLLWEKNCTAGKKRFINVRYWSEWFFFFLIT